MKRKKTVIFGCIILIVAVCAIGLFTQSPKWSQRSFEAIVKETVTQPDGETRIIVERTTEIYGNPANSLGISKDTKLLDADGKNISAKDIPSSSSVKVTVKDALIDALTAPDPGISIKRDNAKIPLAAVLQKCPYKKRQIYENKNRNGGCIRMIDIASILQSNERVNIEVKAAGKGIPNSIWETYSSFANTFGGAIILGMDGCW